MAAEDLNSLCPAVFTGRTFYPFDGTADPESEDRERLVLPFEDDFPELFPDDFREEPLPDRFLPEAEGLSGYREAS